MKILQINKFFFLRGGAEKYFFDLAELLTKHGHRVLAWSTLHRQNFPWPQKGDFIRFNDLSKREGLIRDLIKLKNIFWNREANRKLTQLIKREKPEVAHLHNIFGHFSPSIISVLKKYNIPIVMTLHDYKLFCPNYKFYSQGKICFSCLEEKSFRPCLKKKCLDNSWLKSLIGYLEAKWQKDILKTADKIDVFLAPSLFMKRQAQASGIPNKKIIHLPNFVDYQINQLNDLQDKYFLYCGRSSQEKGLEFLLKAFKNKPWKLKIATDKSQPELKRMISRSYAVIVPSLWPENFPYSILESFSLGRPVLAARVGGLPELVKEKETGLLFEPNSRTDLEKKIIWANQHPEEIETMGRTAQKTILKKYNPDKHYQKLIKIYERSKSY